MTTWRTESLFQLALAHQLGCCHANRSPVERNPNVGERGPQTSSISPCHVLMWSNIMPVHIRRCIECPKCQTRYLIGFSPYSNGAHLVSMTPGPSEEYTLYCPCSRPATSTRWKCSEMRSFAVSKSAHARGYGNSDEIVPAGERRRPRPGRAAEWLIPSSSRWGESS